MLVVQCSWEEMQKEQRLFCEQHCMTFKNKGAFFKNDGLFQKKQRTFLQK